jgi:branched-chain amino acid transport system substrate-binding protein
MTTTKRGGLRHTRRAVLAAAATTGTSLAFAIKAPSVLGQPAPVRIGVVNTFTGINAIPADTNLKGMTLYFDRIGWSVAGRKIELIKEDDQFNPQIGLQKVRKLVESDHVDLICGPQASNVAVAVRNYCKESKTLMLVWAGTDSITWERIPFLFRPGLTSWQLSTPMADWIAANVAKEVVLAAADFAAGHDVMRTFKDGFGGKGGKVLKEMYPPLGTGDFSPYLTDILSIAPPVVYAFFTGTDAVRFVQQFAKLGLRAKTRLTGFAPLTDGSTITAQADTAIGVVTPQIYVDSLDTAENKSFVAAYRARYDAFPDTYSTYGFDTARVIASALMETKGDTANKDQLRDAIGKVAFASPRGPFRFDPVTHNPIQNVYITEVAQSEGRLAQKVIATMENVRDPSQKPD